jgi:hypothetical protein
LERYTLELQDGSIWHSGGLRTPVLNQGIEGGWLTFEIPDTDIRASAVRWDSGDETLSLAIPDPPPPI